MKPEHHIVVFVHGNPGSGADWRDLIAPVSRFARVVAPDMPGFAGAEKPWRFPYTVGGYAAHLQALHRDPAQAEALKGRIPARRFGEPGEVAAAVAFLATNEAAYITGQELLVDGGWSI